MNPKRDSTPDDDDKLPREPTWEEHAVNRLARREENPVAASEDVEDEDEPEEPRSSPSWNKAQPPPAARRFLGLGGGIGDYEPSDDVEPVHVDKYAREHLEYYEKEVVHAQDGGEVPNEDIDDADLGPIQDVSLEKDEKEHEPQLWFLPERLQTFYTDYWLERNIAAPSLCPFNRQFTEDPASAERVAKDYVAGIQTWIEEVKEFDPEAENARSECYRLDQKLRTYVILARATYFALSIAFYASGQDDPPNYYQQLLESKTFKYWQKLRTLVYQQTPAYKAKKKARDAARNSDPARKAAEAERKRRLRQDPEFRKREAERKRLSREQREAQDKLLKDV